MPRPNGQQVHTIKGLAQTTTQVYIINYTKQTAKIIPHSLTLAWLGHSCMQVLAVAGGVWFWKELATCQCVSNLV